MLPILNYLNAHNFPIFQFLLMIFVSKFMVHRALSDNTYFLLGLLSPLNIPTNCRPICFGANFTSVTDVLLSTRLVRFIQGLLRPSFVSPIISSQMAAVLSKEHVAITWPNSGWAHVTRQTDPLCV